MIVKVLKESGRANHIYYHYTNPNGLIGILKDNAIKAVKETKHILKGKMTVSLSRIGNGNELPFFVKEPSRIKIVLDGEKIAQRYKLVPYEYLNDSDSTILARANKTSEAEEAVVLGSPLLRAEIYFVDKLVGIAIVDIRDKIIKVLDPLNEKKKLVFKNGRLFLNNDSYKLSLIKENDLVIGIQAVSGSKRYKSFKVEMQPVYLKDVSNYIKRIEIADKVYNDDDSVYVVKGNEQYTPIEYFLSELNKKFTKGENIGHKRDKIEHNIDSFEKFKSSIKFPISTYKSPSSWYIEITKAKKERYTLSSTTLSQDIKVYLLYLDGDYAIVPANSILTVRKFIKKAQESSLIDTDSKFSIESFNSVSIDELCINGVSRITDSKEGYVKSFYRFIEQNIELIDENPFSFPMVLTDKGFVTIDSIVKIDRENKRYSVNL